MSDVINDAPTMRDVFDWQTDPVYAMQFEEVRMYDHEADLLQVVSKRFFAGRALTRFVMGYRRTIDQNKELIDANQQLHYELTHDDLTDMLNKKGLKEAYENLDFTDGVTNYIAFFDLNQFKQINDTYGHDVGDTVLIEVTNTIANSLRQDDTIARLHGDELIILLPKTDKKGAVIVSSLISSFVTSITDFEDHPVNITASIGVAPINPENSFEETLKEADKLMYHAKNLGNDQSRIVLLDKGQILILENESTPETY